MSSGRDKFRKYKGVLIFISRFFSIFGKRGNQLLFNCCRNLSGIVGITIRYCLLRNIVLSCGDNVLIGEGVYILNAQKVIIGNNVSIHPMCYLDGEGGITIGNDVSIAHSSSVLSSNHTWENSSLPIKYNDLNLSSVRIDDDVWIACGVRILAGVTIESRSIIAAGAVVNKSVIGNSLVGGVPGRLIKKI